MTLFAVVIVGLSIAANLAAIVGATIAFSPARVARRQKSEKPR